MSNLWEKGSLGLRRGLIVGIVAGILGCAGLHGRQKKIENCTSSRDIILGRTDEEACDPELLDQFEVQVNNWGVTCFSLVPEEDSQEVWARLLFARECVEKKLRLEAKRQECAERLRQLDAVGSECLGAECEPFLEQIESILLDCGDPELGDVYWKEAQAQRSRFEERKTNSAYLQSLLNLRYFCDEQLNDVVEENPKVAFNRMTKTLRVSKNFHRNTEPDTEADRFRVEMLARCGLALQTAVDALVDAADLVLSSDKVPRTSPKWKQAHRNIRILKGPLKRIKAGQNFPGLVERIDAVLEKHKTQKKR